MLAESTGVLRPYLRFAYNTRTFGVLTYVRCSLGGFRNGDRRRTRCNDTCNPTLP